MAITYSFRPSALEKEKTLKLSETALIIHQGDKTDEAAFAKIKSVRLYFDPSRYATNKFHCDITLKNGAAILIKSIHYVAPTNFEDRGTSYKSFILELHDLLAKQEGISYSTGNKPGCFSLYLLIIVLTVVLVGIALFSFGSSIGAWTIIRLIFLIGLLYWGIVYLRRNKPQAYTPDNIPDKVLPS